MSPDESNSSRASTPPRAVNADPLPTLFAHRGGARGRRENTIRAFEDALRDGATGLETDIRLTADGVPVLSHDRSFRRFRVLKKPIATLPHSLVPPRIPTLDAFYAALGTELPLSVDLKDHEAFHPVLETALHAGGESAIQALLICGQSVEQLGAWRDAEPRVRLVRSADKPPKRIEDARAEFRDLAAVGAVAVNYRARNWTQELIGAAHDVGLKAFAWDANRGSVLTRVVRAGVDAVYADDVPWMVSAATMALRST